MSVVLPNTFSTVSRTVLFDEPTAVDFRSLAAPGLPEELLDQLRAKRFIISTCQVHSEVSGHHSIEFLETLVKIPVQYRGRNYLHPVVTYVDHEYSLIRGYILGFHKKFSRRPDRTDPMVLAVPELNLDLRGAPEASERKEPLPLPPEQQYPFLLWTDYSVGAVRSHGFTTLQSEGYRRIGIRHPRLLRTEQWVAGRQVTARQLYEIEDTYTLVDMHPAEGSVG
ncbi:acetoacetate decarboxylase family protein [Streptomyces sp. NPDC054794]